MDFYHILANKVKAHTLTKSCNQLLVFTYNQTFTDYFLTTSQYRQQEFALTFSVA